MVGPGNVLKGYRLMLNYSRATLADKIGVSAKTIESWETGRTQISIDKALCVREVLGGMGNSFWFALCGEQSGMEAEPICEK